MHLASLSCSATDGFSSVTPGRVPADEIVETDAIEARGSYFFIISSAAMAPVVASSMQADRRVAVSLFMMNPLSYRVM